MSLFDLNPVESEQQYNNAALNPLNPNDIGARWYEGVGTGLVQGAKTSFYRDLYNVGKATKDEPTAQRALTNLEQLKPNPETVGVVGQLMYGLTDTLGTLAFNFAGGNITPQTLAQSAGTSYAGSQEALHIKEGMDPETARSVAVIEGAGLGLGAVLPGNVAGGLVMRATSGAAINLVMGAGQRALIQNELNKAGYAEMAKQYAPFDGVQSATDIAIGAFFGGLLGERPRTLTTGPRKTSTGTGGGDAFVPPQGFTTADNMVEMARMRLAQLRVKRDGFEEVTLEGPDGKPMTVPGQQPELLTDSERREIKLLEENDGNADMLAKAYGFGLRKDLMPSDIDTVLTQNNAAHIELGTAPGVPTDLATRQAHVDMISQAIKDLQEGNPVHATPDVTNGNFMEDPGAVATRNEIADAVRGHLSDLEQLQVKLEERGLPGDTTLYNITDRIYTPPIFAKSELSKMSERAIKEGWSTEELAGRMNDLVERMNLRDANKADARNVDRVRGKLWIEERLTRAERNGELDAEQVRLAKWLIGKNPNIARDLAISMPEVLSGAHGGYEPIQRIASIAKNNTDPLTAVHEFLHHGERLMPDDVRHEIQKAWAAEVKRVTRMAEQSGSLDLKLFMGDVLQANLGKTGADGRLRDMIRQGLVGKEAYQLVNPSEFWAVNASRIIRERASESWVQRAVQWVKELVAKLKDIFGLKSDAAMIRGIDALLKSDGRISGDILAANAPRLSAVSELYPAVRPGDKVGGLIVREHIPNQGSIASSLSNFTELPGIRSFAISALDQDYVSSISLASLDKRTRALADEIKNSGEINPLIVVIDSQGPYILEGAHRIDALVALGVDAFPAKVVLDNESISTKLQNVEAPGKGVAKENLNGFEPDLRVKVPIGKMKLPEKPLILTGTNIKNAARQIAAIDDILAKFPDADASPAEWSKMMAYAMGTDDVPVPPYRFLNDINGTGAYNNISRMTPGQIADRRHGLNENGAAFRQAYVNKELDVETTGKLFMWSFLSRGVSPYTQEGLFLDAFPGIDQWIKKAAAGDLTEKDFGAYEAWAKSVAPQGSGQPGAGATHNLNAFGKLFLFKMGQKGPDGVSLLQKMHDMMEDPNMTGKQLRRWFLQNTEGVGIDNKVVSFTMLVAGFTDVMVLDRVQIRQLWDDGRFGDRNLYDGRKVEGKPVAGSALSEITYGARGLLIYEAIERALAKRVENIYAALGRPEDASIGGYHWDTWVADSQQEASHGTLDAILHDAKGNKDKISEVTAKEGEYGAYQYGARYGRDAQGQPYFLYTTPSGTEYKFDVPAFREFMQAVKSPANKVVPSKFKVTEAGNAPWYERPEVNKQAIDELAQRYAREPNAGEGAGAVRTPGSGEAVPDLAGRGADPYAPEELMRQAPALTYIGEDGTMVPAAKALARADEEITTAQRDAQGFGAAVACALRG